MYFPTAFTFDPKLIIHYFENHSAFCFFTIFSLQALWDPLHWSIENNLEKESDSLKQSLDPTTIPKLVPIYTQTHGSPIFLGESSNLTN